MDFLKTVAGRIVTGLLALGVIAAGISWWSMDESTRHMLASGTGRILAWFGIVLAWPWVSIWLISRVAKMESNLAGGVLVAAYSLVEIVLLAWLFQWHIQGSAAWAFVILGGLVAGVYNLLICDWIAEIGQ